MKDNYQTLPGFIVKVTFQDLLISLLYAQQIRHAFHSPNIANYYFRRYNWTPNSIDLIDWHGLQQVLKSLSSTRKTKILKLLHNWYFRNPKSNFNTSIFPCVQTESTLHFFHCHLNSDKFDRFIKKINTTLKHLRTYRPLRKLLISYFRQVTPTPWGPRKAQLETVIR